MWWKNVEKSLWWFCFRFQMLIVLPMAEFKSEIVKNALKLSSFEIDDFSSESSHTKKFYMTHKRRYYSA